MGKSVKRMLDEFKQSKGFVHEEEKEEKYKTNTDPETLRYYGGKPTRNDNGEFEYVQKYKETVPDAIDEKDINTVIHLEQHNLLNGMSKDIAGALKSLTETQKTSENYLRILKNVGIFFTVLTIINLILAIIQAVSIASAY